MVLCVIIGLMKRIVVMCIIRITMDTGISGMDLIQRVILNPYGRILSPYIKSIYNVIPSENFNFPLPPRCFTSASILRAVVIILPPQTSKSPAPSTPFVLYVPECQAVQGTRRLFPVALPAARTHKAQESL